MSMCPDCGKDGIKNLANHKAGYCPKGRRKGGGGKCRYCRRKFKTAEALARHEDHHRAARANNPGGYDYYLDAPR